MKARARLFPWLLIGLSVAGAGTLLWLGIENLLADETTGLDYVGVPASPPSSPGTPGATEAEFRARWHAESLLRFGEPPIREITPNPNTEAYRFCYEPSFNSNVCVTIWQDADQYWLRTSVLRRYAPSSTLWRKTRPLSAGKWSRLRMLFQKPSVADPLNGENPYAGIDGSSWYLESLVSGHTALTEISNPVRSMGLPHFQFVRPRESRLKDFVDTSLLFLDWGGVRVPVMY
jgi:hypothetical protein